MYRAYLVEQDLDRPMTPVRSSPKIMDPDQKSSFKFDTIDEARDILHYHAKRTFETVGEDNWSLWVVIDDSSGKVVALGRTPFLEYNRQKRPRLIDAIMQELMVDESAQDNILKEGYRHD